MSSILRRLPRQTLPLLRPRFSQPIGLSHRIPTSQFHSASVLLAKKKKSNAPKAAASNNNDPILPTDQTAQPLKDLDNQDPVPPKAEAEPATTGPDSDLLRRLRAQTGGAPEPEPEVEPETAGSGSGSGGRGGRKKEYETSAMKRRDRMASIIFALSMVGVVAQVVYLGRNWEDEEEENAHPDAPSGWAFGSFFKRIKTRVTEYMDYFKEPAFEQLLPDPIPDPNYQRPYTLVLSLEDVLVHTEWTKEHGWRMAKRPGLDYFLGYLFQYYELVIFTDMPAASAMPMIQKINEYPGYIMHALFRDSAVYEKGKYIKDLNYLNRDLSKVVMISSKPEHWERNPNNTVKLAPWKGNADDKTLVGLIPFLEYLAGLGIPDVRPIIEGFGDKEVISEYARREMLAREEWKKQQEEKKAKAKVSAGRWVMGALGVSPSHGTEEKFIFDIQRERGIQAYEATQKHLMENKELLLKEQADQEKEMNEAMRTSLGRMLTEGLPKPPTQ